jgi:hypothetical protein
MYFAGDGARRTRTATSGSLGRIDDVLNVSGHRLGTAEIESALVSHPAVAEAAVVGSTRRPQGQAIVAFVTLKGGVDLPTRRLEEELRASRGQDPLIGAIAGDARTTSAFDAAALPKTRSRQDHAANRAAQGERARLLNQTTDAQQELEEKRAGLMKKLELIARERDKVVHLAKEIRRRYEGLKTKLAVLAEEDDPENEKAIADAKQKMRDLRADFQSLKKKRTQIGERLDRGDAILSQVEDKLGDRRKVRRDEAARTFHIIGKANRDISNHRAQLGLIETQEQQLYAEIGRYVSRNHKASPLLQSIYRENQALIDIMIALRRSIIMNRKLTSQFD